MRTVVGTAIQKVSCSPTAQAQEQGWLWLCKTEWSEKRNSVNPNYPGFKSLESPLIWRENYDFMPTTRKKEINHYKKKMFYRIYRLIQKKLFTQR